MLDLNLRKVDGFEVLRAIPVIVLSSSSDGREVRRACELGANAYIVKPMDDFVDLVGDFERFGYGAPNCQERLLQYSQLQVIGRDEETAFRSSLRRD